MSAAGQDASPTSAQARKKKQPARREKGEQTRRRILDATLRVICRDGIRGVTHRSAASEAGVHLSLTTYYFTDIEEMIREAFKHFCNLPNPELEQAMATAAAYLDSFTARELRKRAVREQASERLAVLAGDHLYQQILHNPDRLAIEQILFSEARLSPAVRQVGLQHRQMQIRGLLKLCRYFNRRDPEINAELLFGAIMALQYQRLGLPRSAVDRDHIITLLHRQMSWLTGLST